MTKARDIASATTPNANAALLATFPHRNLIINGAMQVAQRGTSFTGITDQYTLDRWTSSSAGGVSLNVSQQTATSSDNTYFASKHFARYQRNAVLSGFVHKVEDLQRFNNKTFTLSFWAKSADAGTTVTLTVYTVNDGSSFNSYVTKTYVTNPTLSSSWQKYEMRLTFQDMYSYGYSGSHHLRLQFFDGSNAATFDIAEVQLEVGEQATPFEHRSYGDELARCLRYYEKKGQPSTATAWSFYEMNAVIAQATNYVQGDKFKVEKRTDPTLVFYSRNGTSGKISSFNSGGDVTGSWAQNAKGATGFHAVVGPASSVTKGDGYEYGYTADAEL